MNFEILMKVILLKRESVTLVIYQIEILVVLFSDVFLVFSILFKLDVYFSNLLFIKMFCHIIMLFSGILKKTHNSSFYNTLIKTIFNVTFKLVQTYIFAGILIFVFSFFIKDITPKIKFVDVLAYISK